VEEKQPASRADTTKGSESIEISLAIFEHKKELYRAKIASQSVKEGRLRCGIQVLIQIYGPKKSWVELSNEIAAQVDNARKEKHKYFTKPVKTKSQMEAAALELERRNEEVRRQAEEYHKKKQGIEGGTL